MKKSLFAAAVVALALVSCNKKTEEAPAAVDSAAVEEAAVAVDSAAGVVADSAAAKVEEVKDAAATKAEEVKEEVAAKAEEVKEAVKK